MAGDYISAPHAEFDSWQENWFTYAAANAVALRLDPIGASPPIQAAQGKNRGQVESLGCRVGM